MDKKHLSAWLNAKRTDDIGPKNTVPLFFILKRLSVL